MIEPYYQSDRAVLYHGDAADILPSLDKGTLDLMVTDPPYGQEYQSGWRQDTFQKIAGDERTTDLTELLKLAASRLRRGRHLYVFGPADLSSLPLEARCELVWDKDLIGMGNLALPWGTSHEPITFGVWRPDRKNPTTSQGGLTARLRRGSVLRVKRVNANAHRHPTEKPIALLRQLIESSSSLGDTVLDPFVGVGSTLVAASLEGRKSIGIEIDEGYCQVAADRLMAVEAVLDKLEAA